MSLGDSLVNTQVNPFWYPFDSYMLTFIYVSYYPSEVNMKFIEVEDLELSITQPIRLIILRNGKTDNPVNVSLIRKNKIHKYVWPIISIIVPIVIFFIKKENKRWLFRIILYPLAATGIYFNLPHPVNVPIFNLCNILVCAIFTGLVVVEITTSKRVIRTKAIG
jgi:hypothetical protein